MALSSILTASFLALRLFSLPVGASPTTLETRSENEAVANGGAYDGWWMSSIKRSGTVPFSNQTDYQLFRNVKDFGAKGDGNTDDTAAINAAVASIDPKAPDGGKRCGLGCDSSTTTPAIVYFPPGEYKVSAPIIAYYYTQLIGDAVNVPTLKAAAEFSGIAVIDADPYEGENNWYTNQNNFFRQVRNFKIDLTAQPMTKGTGIHWQVAQATSLQNIEFNMIQDKSEDNKQQGIFMENGSGGFLSDLTFNGGKYGAFLGNQQFTTRGLTFQNCNTAIFMNWNWLWTLHGITIKDCGVGLNMSQADQGAQSVGSVMLLDSTISNTPVGIITIYNPEQTGTNGTLILDNVDMRKNVPVAVQNGVGNRETIQAGNTLIKSWVQGRSYKGSTGAASQGMRNAVEKPSALLNDDGNIVTKSKPQYEKVPASKFVSVKSKGAKGDGKTDDTAALQQIFDDIKPDEIVYFDHGAYVVMDTVRVPKNVKIVGEIWPLIMAGGDSTFKDQKAPKPVFQIGQKDDVGEVEIQDLMFETKGPQPGAILVEFNVKGSSKGSAGMWDVHFRVGGSAGTELQSDKCSKTPEIKTEPNPECMGAFMLMHVTPSASVYLENSWMWVADHELDRPDHNQINIYNGRGLLLESKAGAWLWGTASEHSVMSNYQLNEAENVFMAAIQTETAYFQGNPDARAPFNMNSIFSDPDFSSCTGEKCARTWGLRVNRSKDVLVYGGGLYSFFDNYAQECVDANNCQENMIGIRDSEVSLFGISTKASVSMVTLEGESAVKDADNRNNFCAAIAAFETS